MEYTKLGSTGLDVSRICLGCMSYGEPERGNHLWSLDEQASRPFIKRAVEAGHQLLRHGERLLRRLQRGDRRAGASRLRPPRRDRARHQGPRPDASRAERRRPVPQGDHGRDRRQPAPARRRLRRPLPDPPVGPDRADRGDPRGAARRRQGRQGPLHRRLVDVGLAVLQGAVPRRPARLDPVRLHAEPLQPALPRGGAGDAAAVRRPGRRGHSVEPAGPRAADPGLGRAAPPAPRPTSSARPSTPRTTGSSSRRSPGLPHDRGVSRAQVALAWMLHNPVITAPIVGATKMAHLEDAIAAVDVTLTDDEVAQLEKPYAPRENAGFR